MLTPPPLTRCRMYLRWYVEAGSAEKGLAAADRAIAELAAECERQEQRPFVPTARPAHRHRSNALFPSRSCAFAPSFRALSRAMAACSAAQPSLAADEMCDAIGQRRTRRLPHSLTCASLPLKPQGSAFVTFSYERHAKAALKDLGRSRLRQLALFCKNGRGAPPRFKGRALVVRRAPEPSDVQWGNTSCRGLDKAFRHFAAYALTLLVIGAGGVMQWGFNRAKEDQRVALLQLEVAGQAGSSADVYRLRGLSAANGLAIVLINNIVQYILPKLNDFERFHTYRRGFAPWDTPPANTNLCPVSCRPIPRGR